MPSENNSQPLLRKSYLIILGLAVVIMMVVNPNFKDYILGLIPKFGSGKSEIEKTGEPRDQSDIAGICQDVSDLARWLQDAPRAKINIKRRKSYKIAKLDPNPVQADMIHYNVVNCDRTELNVADLKAMLILHRHPEKDVWGEIDSIIANEEHDFTVAVRVSGRGQIGLAVENSTPEYYDLQVRSMWPVPVSGTSLALGGWKAAAGSHVLEQGDTIRPSAGLCGYRVLSISRKCVWLAAFYDDEGMDANKLPSVRWPDLKGVIVDSVNRKDVKGLNNMRPASKQKAVRLELRNNLFLKPSDAILFKRTGSRIILDRLWPNAAKFRYDAKGVNGSDQMLDLLCVIVRSN